jgi:non-canonical (house-cleaning) NTP pyrophosphatase
MSGRNLSAVIGSAKAGKIEGCRRALAVFDRLHSYEVIGIDSPSGVSGVPVSEAECLIGAANRAAHCRQLHPDASYWVGVESGLRTMVGGVSAMTTYAFVRAHDGRLGFASSSSHPVGLAAPPDPAGASETQLLAQFPSGNQSIAQLTGGAYTLEHKTYEAVLCALVGLGLCPDPREKS